MEQKKTLTFYLAHPRLDMREVRDWQLHMEDSYSIKFENPFYRNNTETEIIKKIDMQKGYNYTMADSNKVTEGDLHLIKKRDTDGLVAIVTEAPTLGTPMEIFFNNYLWCKPTFIIAPESVQTNKGNWHPIGNHPWIQRYADKIFAGKQEFEEGMASGEIYDIVKNKDESLRWEKIVDIISEMKANSNGHGRELADRFVKNILTTLYEPSDSNYEHVMDLAKCLRV